MKRRAVCVSMTLAWSLLLSVCAPAIRDTVGPLEEGQERWVRFSEARDEYVKALEGGRGGGNILDEAECRRMAGLFERVSDGDWLKREAIYNSALLWRQCGDQERALGLFKQLVAIDEDREQEHRSSAYVPALIHLSAFEHEAGREEEALELLERARATHDRSPELATNLALLLIEEGDLSESQLYLRQAIVSKASTLTTHILMARLYLKLADALAQPERPSHMKMLGLVEIICQRAIEKAGQSEDAKRGLASIHNIRGLLFVRKGETDLAADAFEAATKLAPALYVAHMNLGLVSLSYRDFMTANKAFGTALELRPTSYPAHLGLGAALRGQERVELSREVFIKARELDPDRPEATYNLGVLSQDYSGTGAEDLVARLKHMEQAKQYYREVLSKCAQQQKVCADIRPDEGHEEELRQAARRRLDECDRAIHHISKTTH